MTIKQFKDDALAHFSYTIISDGEMAVIDPARNPFQYYEYAGEQKARIIAVFETHPHADFVSSHLQIMEETGASIFVSQMVGADYPHKAFDEGQSMALGNITIKAIHTPGHSPDSLTFVAQDGDTTALFTGDTLFIGNVGRPDLREKVGNKQSKQIELAKAMFNTIKTKFEEFPDEALVYPAHGAGSLCGKNMSSAGSSTLGDERKNNWAFQKQTEEEFVAEILQDQPFIPSYFGFNVDLNRKGAPNVQRSKSSIPVRISAESVEPDVLVIDVRNEKDFKNNHLPNSFNIMARGVADKFETWLGAIVEPGEAFYLVAQKIKDFDEILERVAKIGYELQVKAILTLGDKKMGSSDVFDLEEFKNKTSKYTIVDIRNRNEVAEGKIFDDAIAIPLNELRNRSEEIPGDKPILVHCAGGYRSASGSSILEKKFSNIGVFDLSEAIKKFS